MACNKKAFDTQKEVAKRANEINESNAKNSAFKKGKILTLRYYQCDSCGKYHLTSMDKHAHKYATNKKYQKEVNKKSFLNKETDYWKRKLGIND